MLWILERLGIAGPQVEARELNADARRILDGAEKQYGAATLAAIARTLRERRDEVHELSLGKHEHYAQGLKHLLDVNAELRRSNDQPSWTAVTLAIIYLKAEINGSRADPARACIDDFLERFRYAEASADDAIPPEDIEDKIGDEPASRSPQPFRHRPWRN